MTSGQVRTLSDELGQSYFNANKMRPEQVAQVFVKSSYLEALTSRDNVVLVGPRGSGKTTLMKMLTRTALDSWSGPLRDQLLQLPSLPIYIGSDTVLRAQLQVPENQLPKGPARTAFAATRRGKLGLHLVQTVLDAVEHELVKDRAAFLADGEENLCRRICGIFRLSPAFQSLEALRDALSDAQLEMSSSIQAAADGDGTQVQVLRERYRTPSLADVITKSQEAFASSISGLPPKWLLLFDEIEYLHEASRSEILQLIRTLGPSFGLKIALTPLSIADDYLTEVEDSFLHAGHDFKPVTLGFEDSRTVLDFSETLTRNILERLVPEYGSLAEAFGVSAFADPKVRDSVASHYQTTQRLPDQQLVNALAAAQPRFSKYANDAELLGDGVASLTPAQRASRFRKALPVMTLWLERLRPAADLTEGTVIGRRSRKVHSVYTGYPTILLLADGNPRALMGMLNRLLKKLRDNPSARSAGLQPLFRQEWQDSAIESARREQISLANAYLSRHGRVLGDMFAIDVIHRIGRSFEEAVHLGKTFSPDPATTFKIDSTLSPQLSRAIIDGFYTGVLVALDPILDKSLLRPSSELIGSRFRLSFLQGTQYWLPVRKGRQVNLSSILSTMEGSPQRQAPRMDQGRMF